MIDAAPPHPGRRRRRRRRRRLVAGAHQPWRSSTPAARARPPPATRRSPRRCASCPPRSRCRASSSSTWSSPATSPALGGEVLGGDPRAASTILLRLAVDRPVEGLERFRKDFNERYEGREVPLLQALDEEVGIGFERAGRLRRRGLAAAARASRFGGRRRADASPGGASRPSCSPKLNRALAEGGAADRDHRRGSRPHGARPTTRREEIARFPDAFHVMATLAAASQEALDAGRLPAPVRQRGRPLGRAAARPLLPRRRRARPRGRGPPARRGGAPARTPIFAEIVHLPQGRIGNILARPVLREHEIPFLGRSGAPPRAARSRSPTCGSRCAGQRIVLRSARLGREVIPRLTTAHNFVARQPRHLPLPLHAAVAGDARRGELGLGTARQRPLPPPGHQRPGGARPRLLVDAPGRDRGARPSAQGTERYRAVQDWRPSAACRACRPRRRRQRAARRPRQRALDRDLPRRRRGARPGAAGRVLPRPGPAVRPPAPRGGSCTRSWSPSCAGRPPATPPRTRLRRRRRDTAVADRAGCAARSRPAPSGSTPSSTPAPPPPTACCARW